MKLIYMCGNNTRLTKPAAISLCGEVLPWVESADHLGHVLHQSGTMDHDVKRKRAEYISKCVQVHEMLKFAIPVEILHATDIYCSSYYGSLASWDLALYAFHICKFN